MTNKSCELSTISQADIIEAMHEYAKHHHGCVDDETYEFVSILTGLSEDEIWKLLHPEEYVEREITVIINYQATREIQRVYDVTREEYEEISKGMWFGTLPERIRQDLDAKINENKSSIYETEWSLNMVLNKEKHGIE